MNAHTLSRRALLRGLGASAALVLGRGILGRAQATPIKVAVIPGSINFADVYAGVTQGFFADQGLDVELVSFLNGALANNALAGGQVDFAPLPGGYVPFVRPAGLPHKIVAARTRLNSFSLVSSLALPTGELSLEPLRGQTLAIEALGATITWAVAINYLQKAGLNPDSDVKLVALGGRAAASAALQSGQAVASVLDGPSDEQLVQSGAAARWIDPLVPAQHKRWIGNTEELALAWITREDVIATKPDTVNALVQAANSALRFLNGSTAEALAPSVAPFFEGLDVATLTASLGRYLQTLAPDVTISRHLYENDLQKWIDLKLVSSVPFEAAVEGSFAGTRD